MSAPSSHAPAAYGLPSTAFRKLSHRLRVNGPRWLAYHLADRGSHRISEYFARKCLELERARHLPGWNTVENNRAAWSQHDWSQGGDEWSESPQWAESLVEAVMYAELPADSGANVLEIGPGAGRWTEQLHERSASLLLADITERTLALCRQRLGDPGNVTYIVTNGRGLPSIESASVDFIWSYDVFVHIAPVDIKGYIDDFARIMRPGARGVIHHAGAGNVDGGWRSSMTAELFVKDLEKSGLRAVRQFDRWGPDGRYGVPHVGDTITVFEHA